MDTLFRWIHLSDIHLGHGDTTNVWDQRLVLAEIAKDIGVQRRSQPEPPFDAILVTGDIANTGAGRSATEYADAAAWLDQVGAAAGVPRERIFLVPGNHDVDRGADKDEAVKQLVTDLREGRSSIDDALTRPAERALLARRMERYLDFAGGFAPIGKDADARLCWVHRFVAPSGLAVRLVGLNTSLLAAGDDDQGKLRVGLKQIDLAFADVPEGELVLALGHHPLGDGWLADQALIEPWLKRHAHALLTGHVHVANAEELRGGSGSTFLRVVAGSAHGDKMPPGVPAIHGYSFGAVVRGDDGEARARITPRKWSEKNARFVPDGDNVPEGQSYSDHPLQLALSPSAIMPASLAKPAAPKAVQVVPGEPVPLFISSAPEDDALRVELQKHIVQLRRTRKAVFASSREIPPGADKATWIAEQIGKARIILLLISKDYIGSDEYYEDELLRAVERHDRGEARVIPILLRPFSVSGEPFAKLQALPRDAGSVDRYPGGRDEAFKGIAQEVSQVVAAMRGESAPAQTW